MNYLAIDTSTDKASICLLFNGEFFLEHQDNIRTHANQLLPMVDKILKKSGCTLNRLNGLVVGRGPGSFTGLRIAISHVKGIAYAHNLPVFPVSTLQSIAYKARQEVSVQVFSVIDARMNQLYWSLEDNIEHVTDAGEIQVDGNQPLVIAGVGFQDYLQKLDILLQKRVIKTMEIYPCTKAMISLVIEGKIQACTADEVLPVYIRNNVTHS